MSGSNLFCEQNGLHMQRHGVLTFLFATQVFGASGVRANSGVGVVHQGVPVGALEARADHVCGVRTNRGHIRGKMVWRWSHSSVASTGTSSSRHRETDT